MPIPGGIDTPIGGGIDMSTPISIILWLIMLWFCNYCNADSHSSRLNIRLHPVCIRIIGELDNALYVEEYPEYHKGVAFIKVGESNLLEYNLFFSLWANNEDLKYVEYADPINNVVWCIFYEWDEWYEAENRSFAYTRIGQVLANVDHHVEMSIPSPNQVMWNQACSIANIISGYDRYYTIHNNQSYYVDFYMNKLRTYESYFNQEFIAVKIRDNIRILWH
jgi:hypothetical protein